MSDLVTDQTLARHLAGGYHAETYNQHFNTICQYFRAHPERLTRYAATGGVGAFTLGEARLYCIRNGLTVPPELQGGRLEPEEIHYQSERQAEVTAAQLAAMQRLLEAQGAALPPTSDPSTGDLVGGDAVSHEILRAMRTLQSRGAAIETQAVMRLLRERFAEGKTIFIDERDDGLIFIPVRGGANYQTLTLNHLRRRISNLKRLLVPSVA